MALEKNAGGKRGKLVPNQGPKLTNQQKLFLAEYKRDCNGERAAAAAGYAKGSVMSLMNPKVSPLVVAEIKRMEAEKSKQAGIDAAWVVEKLGSIAAATLTDFYNDDGTLKKLSELSESAAYAVEEVITGTRVEIDGKTGEKSYTTYVKGYRLNSKMEALKQLGQHLGKLQDHVVNIQNNVVFDWNAFLGKVMESRGDDPIEAVIEQAGKITSKEQI
jgi:phage terminase small subunit